MLNESQFRSIYDDYLESGLTVRDFCSNQHMNEAKVPIFGINGEF